MLLAASPPQLALTSIPPRNTPHAFLRRRRGRRYYPGQLHSRNQNYAQTCTSWFALLCLTLTNNTKHHKLLKEGSTCPDIRQLI